MRSRYQKGFTLIEIMTSVAISIFLIAAIYGIMETGQKGVVSSDETLEALQGGQIALSVIESDIKAAGILIGRASPIAFVAIQSFDNSCNVGNPTCNDRVRYQEAVAGGMVSEQGDPLQSGSSIANNYGAASPTNSRKVGTDMIRIVHANTTLAPYMPVKVNGVAGSNVFVEEYPLFLIPAGTTERRITAANIGEFLFFQPENDRDLNNIPAVCNALGQITQVANGVICPSFTTLSPGVTQCTQITISGLDTIVNDVQNDGFHHQESESIGLGGVSIAKDALACAALSASQVIFASVVDVVYYYINNQDQLIRESFNGPGIGGIGGLNPVVVAENIEDVQFEFMFNNTSITRPNFGLQNTPAQPPEFFNLNLNQVVAPFAFAGSGDPNFLRPFTRDVNNDGKSDLVSASAMAASGDPLGEANLTIYDYIPRANANALGDDDNNDGVIQDFESAPEADYLKYIRITVVTRGRTQDLDAAGGRTATGGSQTPATVRSQRPLVANSTISDGQRPVTDTFQRGVFSKTITVKNICRCL
jgi:prepilin-type N-terminal cleavage/methylation domain-containing protein